MDIPLPNLPYTRTYRFGMEHIAKLSMLAEMLRKDQSAIVREAIDEYYARNVNDGALKIVSVEELPRPADAEPVPVVNVDRGTE